MKKDHWWNGIPNLCPNCGSEKSDVTNTRAHGGRIYRRRKCGECRENFSTAEVTVGRSGLASVAAPTLHPPKGLL
jgi:uncharacterized protein (DUF983 family)